MIKHDEKNLKVAGIIVECNPFHKGHKRLIKECKKYADVVVAVMSGNFVQRGEPAVYDKDKRVKDLLKNGVDMVIELPLIYVLSSAKYFAKAGVSILDSLGFIDYIVFGAKIVDVKRLKGLAELTHTKELAKLSHTKGDIELTSTDQEIRKNLKMGKSYAKAVGDAMGCELTSNDILAIEYIGAIDELESKIVPIAIERKDDLPTASELRAKIKKKVTTNDFTEILNYKILYAKTMADGKDKNILDDIYLMTCDMRNAIMKTADKWISFDDRAKLLNTKNRTLAYIKRVFFNIIFGIKKAGSHSLPIREMSSHGSLQGFIRYAQSFTTWEVEDVKSMAIIILGVKDESKWILKNIKVPFLMSFAPSSYRSFIKKYENSKVVKKNGSGGFVLAPMIKKTILADMLYKRNL